MATFESDLKLWGPTIKNAATGGSVTAQRVVLLYELHCSAPNDPGPRELCEAALRDWMRTEGMRRQRVE